ncbi:MAG: flagellar biosynthesis anti-sigma factor FlgM [Nitrospiraceae bacterium]
MQISGHGKPDHLAKLLLGIQKAEVVSAKQRTQQDGRQDRVQLSDRAKEIRRIKVLADQPDAAREERIERISRAVDAGTYSVSGKQVADALIRQTLTDAVL